MPLIAGIDIGNATTEVALASDDPQARAFVASGIVATTGMKGTRDNIAGTLAALEQAPGENTVVDERCLSHLS